MNKKIDFDIEERKELIISTDFENVPTLREISKIIGVKFPKIEHKIIYYKDNKNWVFDEYFGFKSIEPKVFFNTYYKELDELKEEKVLEYIIMKLMSEYANATMNNTYSWEKIINIYLSQKDKLKTVDNIKKCCDTCQMNAGYMCIAGWQTKDKPNTYGMHIEKTDKLYPNGCENWKISYSEYEQCVDVEE